MKRSLLPLLALGAALLVAGHAADQRQTKSGAAPAAPPPQQKLVRVATLNGIDANRDFQANVQLVQSQRQTAIELNSALEKEKDSKRKAELKTQLAQLMARLNENNAKMQKAYGFTLNRNYTIVIETAHIYMFVSDEEAARIEKQAQAEAQKAGNAKAGDGKK